MSKNCLFSLALSFLLVSFLFLASAQKGFAGLATTIPVCCQFDGFCSENLEGGPLMCIENGIVENATCNEDTGLCDPLQRPIPTLSEWGLIAMAGILGIAGFIVTRRKKAAA